MHGERGAVSPAGNDSVSVVEFASYDRSVPEAFDGIGAGPVLGRQKAVLVKPNLVESLPPPITTPVECVEAVIRYVRSVSTAEIVVAEGCGAASHGTDRCFRDLGYVEMAARLGVRLVDLNSEPTEVLRNPACRVFPEFHMPRIAMTHYVISVPVLKAHSLAIITGTMKNMMGFAPPAHYQQGGHWKKSAFHVRMQESIVDLVRHRAPDLSLMDARVGMPDHHLGGSECSPPVCRLVAGFNPLAVDRAAAGLLGLDWKKIPHLRDM
jgi:uncharacterized protein (DUF362 family)